MFLYQKLNYKYSEDVVEMFNQFKKLKPNYIVYDTETTGLSIMKDKPFLFAVGFEKQVYIFEPTKKNLELFQQMLNTANKVIAHNAKYDYHMCLNIGLDMSKAALGDSMTVARLTNYADSLLGLSLEKLGEQYVDENAKFAGKVIKKQINSINKIRRTALRNYIKSNYSKDYKEILQAYDNRVPFITTPFDSIFDELDKIYTAPNYKDAYIENPQFMKNYAADDVVITLEYLKQALPILKEVDKDLKIFKQESRLISQVGDMERVGLTADIQYLLNSRETVAKYKKTTYKLLHSKLGVVITVNQHKRIKEILAAKYNLHVESVDIDSLKNIAKQASGELKEIVELILELRSLEKWQSTYIEGMLKRIQGGKVYVGVNNSGTVSGRVSSDMQQQPKDPLIDRNDNELFHPRKVFINPKDYRMFYFDYSQMELRIQAQYTIWISGGDVNLCQAYMPFNYTSCFTGQIFDYNDINCLSRWNSGEWIDENGKFWKPVDLHNVTTSKAFPTIQVGTPEFEEKRKYGKLANFLKNYGGGVDAIQSSLNVSKEIAKALDNGYYEAFPQILEYQKWVNNKLHKYGYVENLYGRRYYMRNSRWFYKAINYIIQGGGADMVKEKQIQIDDLLKDKKSSVLLPIHDEIQILIHKDEEYLVPEIKQIMEAVYKVMPNVPMICDIEVTDTNWAEKYDYEVKNELEQSR